MSDDTNNDAAARGTDEVAAASESREPASISDRADEYLRLAQRAQADLQNFRRRADQERDDLRQTVRVDTLSFLLPVLDDFERATSAVPEDARALPWVQGLFLIERNLRGVLEKAGFERIDALGQPFDPWEHEAIMTDASGQCDDNTVAAVFRSGYRVSGRVIRPAQVSVARRPA
ncbi:MAG: nucleotide exchange factor GrpE [Chloroflexota bacterium]|nr:MAG: nucleotide exchange factor GrpE [Chloroflexota bacterium]